ncbi:MAG: hypothetical protein ABIH42_00065 [Planctomycetota bacterium]
MSKKQKRKLLIFTISVICILLIIYITRAKRGEIFDSLSVSLKKGDLEITAYKERGICLFVPGAYYDFCFKKTGDNLRIKIATFRHDDPITIPRNQIHTLDDNITYFFIGWLFGVTSNGGNTWHLWNATKEIENFRENYGFIQAVEINCNGAGSMATNTGIKLYTNNYGISWH